MTTFNKSITIEEARELVNCKNGMQYPSTEHNKVMIAKALGEVIAKLHGKI